MKTTLTCLMALAIVTVFAVGETSAKYSQKYCMQKADFFATAPMHFGWRALADQNRDRQQDCDPDQDQQQQQDGEQDQDRDQIKDGDQTGDCPNPDGPNPDCPNPDGQGLRDGSCKLSVQSFANGDPANVCDQDPDCQQDCQQDCDPDQDPQQDRDGNQIKDGDQTGDQDGSRIRAKDGSCE